MFIVTKYDLDLMIPVDSFNNKLADSAAKIAIHNFEWRYITFVIFNSTIIANGVDTFLKSYKRSQIIGKGLFYPSFAQKTRQLVIFGTDIDNISRMLKWMDSQQFDNTGKCIAICESIVPDDCDEAKAVELFWNYKITNVVFVKDENGDAVGYSYFYSSKTCRNGNPIRIESISECNYDDKSSCDGFFPEKLNNLYRCPLTVSTFLQIPYMNLTNGVPRGADGDLLLLIAEGLNASLKVVTPQHGDGWGMIEADGQWSGSLRDLLDDIANFSMTSAALTLSRFSEFQMSIGYYYVRVGWITHPAIIKPSSLKLLQPFNIMSLITFISVFIVVLICGWFVNRFYYLRCELKEKATSSDIVFYLWMLCMGVPSTRLPVKPAFLCMMFLWIWYCFLIRTLYQVYLMGCLQGNFYYENINSIEEAYMSNYSFGGGGALRDYFIDYPLVYDNWKNVNSSDLIPTLLKLADGKKFVLSMNLETAKTVITKRKLLVKILPQKVVGSPTVLFFKKFSPLVEASNTVLRRLIETGFASKIYSNNTGKLVLDDGNPLMAINLEHYTGCYVILAVGWVTSILFFLMEISCQAFQNTFIWKYFTKLFKKINSPINHRSTVMSQ